MLQETLSSCRGERSYPPVWTKNFSKQVKDLTGSMPGIMGAPKIPGLF